MTQPARGQKSKDYRIFVGAFPDGELAARIQALRQKYDPKTARITPPHVTIAGTYWRSGPATIANEEQTITCLNFLSNQLQKFDLVLGGIHTFPPVYSPVIYLGVEMTSSITSIRHRLLESLDESLGPDGHRHFSPHMTLAMRLKGYAADTMLSELKGSEWDACRYIAPINKLKLMQRCPEDPAWRAIYEFNLQ